LYNPSLRIFVIIVALSTTAEKISNNHKKTPKCPISSTEGATKINITIKHHGIAPKTIKGNLIPHHLAHH